tara:strand:- start:1528 stop:2646 length:1119 start_codon:yes stop_codon:yes gene_type:complete
MKKLIFRNFAKDTLIFFSITCLTIGIIVWTLQAVNYFDYVSQDGHGLKTYFTYILFNFPKIIHRIVPFIFFISLFYIINEYEYKNELQIFWTFGISKIDFANKILILSVVVTIIQICFGSFLSPLSQLKGREMLKNSNIDFFTSLIKEGKFINAVDGLTIFIDDKKKDGSFSNIFLDDSSKSSSKMIYAKNGLIIDNNNKKVFRLYNGKVINKDKKKINAFEFDQIDFNLADYSSSTIVVPKIQEVNSRILLSCSTLLNLNDWTFLEYEEFVCNEAIMNDVNQEIFKRFFKPLYIPIITIISCFLIIFPKNTYKYERNKKIIFLLNLLILIISETSLRYSTVSNLATILYLILPLLFFIIFYLIFYRRVKYA